MPRTTALVLLYWLISSLIAHNSFVQTPVKACGKNNKSIFLPA